MLCCCAVHGLVPEQHCPRLGCHPGCQGHWKGCLVPGFPHYIQMRPVTHHSCYQTARKSGIWLHRLMRLCIYSVGTFKNTFHLFCLQLAFYDLVPERRTGFHSKCIKSKSWSSWHTLFFFLFWTQKMEPSFGSFMHEIRSRITSSTFVYCLRLVVCNILCLIVWLTKLAHKTSTEQLGAVSSCTGVVGRENICSFGDAYKKINLIAQITQSCWERDLLINKVNICVRLVLTLEN